MKEQLEAMAETLTYLDAIKVVEGYILELEEENIKARKSSSLWHIADSQERLHIARDVLEKLKKELV